MTFVPPPPPPLPPGGAAPRAPMSSDRRVGYIILAVLGVVVGVPFVLGIVAAIALPGVLRARVSANEAAAVAALRRTAAAQTRETTTVADREERSGYEYRFARWTPDRFTYWASPSAASTGTRRFCVDERGVVLQYGLDDAWTVPTPTMGLCPPSGVPVDGPAR